MDCFVASAPRNDVDAHLRDLAACVLREVSLYFPPFSIKGAGNAGRSMRPIATCATGSGRTHTCCQVTPDSPGIPHAMVYGLFRDLPGARALWPPSPALLSANLTPASRCQDHTASPSVSAPFVKGTSTSTASRPAFSDDSRNAPHSGTGRTQ